MCLRPALWNNSIERVQMSACTSQRTFDKVLKAPLKRQSMYSLNFFSPFYVETILCESRTACGHTRCQKWPRK